MPILRSYRLFPNALAARYNLAPWVERQGRIQLIGREVTEAAVPGEPDIGVLKVFTTDSNGELLGEREVWRPFLDGINLEDPRVLQLPNDTMVMCLTALLRDKQSHPVPYPALVRIPRVNMWTSELPAFEVISHFGPGKNITPLSNTLFFFRPDDPEHRHSLLIFSTKSSVPKVIGELRFPTDLDWGSWRMGTTFSPIWLSDHTALFIVHGIREEVINGQSKFIYSLGKAILRVKNNQFEVEVAPQPILTPDDFITPSGEPLASELHPELRRVVYCCGGLRLPTQPDLLRLYVNVGDTATFVVDLSMTELLRDFY